MLRVLRVCREETEEKRDKINHRRGGWEKGGRSEETAQANRETVRVGQ